VLRGGGDAAPVEYSRAAVNFCLGEAVLALVTCGTLEEVAVVHRELAHDRQAAAQVGDAAHKLAIVEGHLSIGRDLRAQAHVPS